LFWPLELPAVCPHRIVVLENAALLMLSAPPAGRQA
jgi:hypothetical protein